jgi:hypothetical protein
VLSVTDEKVTVDAVDAVVEVESVDDDIQEDSKFDFWELNEVCRELVDPCDVGVDVKDARVVRLVIPLIIR